MVQVSSTFLVHETHATGRAYTPHQTITWRIIASTDELVTKLLVLISFPVESEDLSASIGPLETVALPDAAPGDAYRQEFKASSGLDPYQWSLDRPPAWL
jgi:hypothetical protein